MRDENGRFLPGNPGNPRGRPKKENTLAEVIRAKMPKTAIVEKVVEMAKGGDIAACKWLADYGFGRVSYDYENIIDMLTEELRKCHEEIERLKSKN